MAVEGSESSPRTSGRSSIKDAERSSRRAKNEGRGPLRDLQIQEHQEGSSSEDSVPSPSAASLNEGAELGEETPF